ncbi:MAG: hypothetical protein ABFD92_09185 [Planctomycetaceae bacterium]|nr:hypothetical protein [Planctomycetaceae bacterium]
MANPVEAALTADAANALSGTTDPATGAVYNTIGQSPYYTAAYQKEAIWNRILALPNALRVVKDGQATFGVTAGTFYRHGQAVAYAGSTGNALTVNATNYVYLTEAAVLQVNTSGFPAAVHVPLATVTVGAGTYLHADMVDCRSRAMFRAVGQQELTSLQVDLVTGVIDPDGTVMDATGGAGLFKRVLGGWGSGTFVLQGEDAQGNTKTDTLAAVVQLPASYIADADVKINVRAKYAGAGTAGASKTIDAEVYELSVDGAVGADLCATAAITLTGSFADCTFTITDAGLVAGDRLMVLIRTVLQETGGASALAAQIGSIALQYDRAVGA